MAQTATSYSEILTLERQEKRLYLPAKMVEVAGWPKAESGELTVELHEEGRLRLFYADQVRERLKQRRAELVQKLEDEPSNFPGREALLQFEDRYSDVTYNGKSRRVTFHAPVIIHLDPHPDRVPDYFVQAFLGFIDVMSLDLRRARLAKADWFLLPPSH